MENPLLKFVKKSEYVTVKPDKVDGVNVTRMVVKADELNKISDVTWMTMKLLDFCSGFYGYRLTISCATIRVNASKDEGWRNPSCRIRETATGKVIKDFWVTVHRT
jgi:hypothetical protein